MFEVRNRSERQDRNPATGETIAIKASKSPTLKARFLLK
ncbi:MAG: HU family DNA-binding protein [Coprobacillus sp.]|nr:HU family DNA-binding protein [Coprobacillus sp.]